MGICLKLKALWVILVFAPAISAAVLNCTGGAASVPVFNTSSVSGAVGDYTLDCTGGTSGSPPFEINVTAFMNVPVLNTGGWILSDGVNMTAGTLGGTNVIDFLGVPFNPPGAGDITLTVENIFVNPSLEPPGFQFMEVADITSDISFGITNQQQVVAVNAIPEPFMPVFIALGLGGMWLARKGS
jgi:hypothetical protein